MRRAATQGLGAGEVRKVTAGEPAAAPFQPADVDARTEARACSHSNLPLRPRTLPACIPAPPPLTPPRAWPGDLMPTCLPLACPLLCLKAGATLHASLHALLIDKAMLHPGGDSGVKVEKRR